MKHSTPRTAHIRTSYSPWHVELHTRKDPDVLDIVRAIPGCKWQDTDGWWIPKECVADVTNELTTLGYVVTNHVKPNPQPMTLSINPACRPYQRRDVSRILTNRSILLCYEMGLGKTITAIESLRLAKTKHVIIAAHTIGIYQWLRLFKIWWPDAEPTHLSTGVEASNYSGGIALVTHALLDKIAPRKLDAVVIDESHGFKNPKSKRYAGLVKLTRQSAPTYRLMLSGTPIADRAIDIHAQLDWTYPGLFGNYWQFARAFTVLKESVDARTGVSYGSIPTKAKNISILTHRLQAVAGVATYDKDAPDVPRIIPDTLAWKAPKVFVRNADEYDSYCDRVAAKKAAFAKRWLADVREAGYEGPVAILTHGRLTARTIASQLGTEHIDGSQTGQKRYDKATGTNSITATMHSVNTSIDMLQFHRVLFVELYWSPDVILQIVGRFRRVGLTQPVKLWFVNADSGIEQRMWEILQPKLDDVVKILGMGGDLTKVMKSASAVNVFDAFVQLGRGAKQWTP